MNDEFWLARVKIAKKQGKTVGLVQGSWDLFHIGHLKYMLRARALCDFLVIGMDSDAKIRKRKGITRPVIPEDERSEFVKLLDIADAVVIKGADEPKWDLIKTIHPDVLIAIKENYTEEEIVELHKYCGEVAVLPRQAETSTSDKIRKITINTQLFPGSAGNKKKVIQSAKETAARIYARMSDNTIEPIPALLLHLEDSTDEKCPVAAACFWNNSWEFGANKVDVTIPRDDIDERSELFYLTVEHAEINLLKRLGEVRDLSNTPFYTTLFPCDECMKVLADKGIKKVFYLEDHPQRNWSIRSHQLAEQKGIETVRLI